MPLEDVKFVGTGAWGAGLGRPLTAPEADGNMYALREAIADAAGTPGVGIASIVVTGRQFTVYLTDASSLGPFLLPMAVPRFRGVWAADVSYAAYDIVRVGGYGTYMVVIDHLSEASFDPFEGNSDGYYYVQIGPDPTYSKQAFDVSGSLSINATYQNTYLRAFDALNVYLGAGATSPNAEITFFQAGSGPVTIIPGGGVTIVAKAGFDYATSAQGDVMHLRHLYDDIYDLYGDLTPTSA